MDEGCEVVPTLFLMVGLPGAGKTTLAKQIEKERGALRLTPDDWMHALGIDLFDESMRSKIEALQWEISARVLKIGRDVILDFGFWSIGEREDYAARASEIGARVEICFLDLPMEDLRNRVRQRNDEGFVQIDMELLDSYSALFQPPTKEEVERLSELEFGTPPQVDKEPRQQARPFTVSLHDGTI